MTHPRHRIIEALSFIRKNGRVDGSAESSETASLLRQLIDDRLVTIDPHIPRHKLTKAGYRLLAEKRGGADAEGDVFARQLSRRSMTSATQKIGDALLFISKHSTLDGFAGSSESEALRDALLRDGLIVILRETAQHVLTKSGAWLLWQHQHPRY